MHNDRWPEDDRVAACRQELMDTMKRYDVAGSVVLINGDEMAYAYNLETTWNGFVNDTTTPLGFRIRIQSHAIGKDRAFKAMDGTIWTIVGLRNFCNQTQVWMTDLLGILKKHGVKMEGTKPPKAPHLTT